MTKRVVSVDLASILNLASSELKLRLVQMDSASHVLWKLSLFRDLSAGNHINADLLEIRTTAERCMTGGVWVEQMDPVFMLKQVASCAIAWDNYFETILSKPGGGSGVVNGGAQASGSGGGGRGERPSKRPFTAVAEQKGTTMQGATRQAAFDPFISISNQCMADRGENGRKWFIRGQNRAEMDSLMKAGKCVL
jgi:hypothetical protein